jgi:hypothetical protein
LNTQFSPASVRRTRRCFGLAPLRPRALSNWVESESALDSLFDRIFCGKPVPTFPENALVSGHRRGRTDRGPRCAGRNRRLGRGGARLAAPWAVDGLQIGGERPGRTRIARIVLLQEKVQRETEAALGKTACAAMTCRATVREQPGGRLALIEILSVRRTADQHVHCAKDEQTAPPFLPRHKFRCCLHAAVVLRCHRTGAVMSGKCRHSQPRAHSRVMVEQRQKGGGALGVSRCYRGATRD